MKNKTVKGVELKADGDKRIIKGYAAIFNVLDSDEDIIKAGAFRETIINDFSPPGDGKNRVKLLWQHSRAEVIGRPTVLREDSMGLYFEGKVSKTQRGDEALELISDGAIDEMSFGFDVMSAEWMDYGESKMRVRALTRLKLWEISPVTWGASSATSVSAEKADELALLVKALSDTDPTPAQIKSVMSIIDARHGELDALRSLLNKGNKVNAPHHHEVLDIMESLDSFNNFLKEN